jgi:hypothetical protein
MEWAMQEAIEANTTACRVSGAKRSQGIANEIHPDAALLAACAAFHAADYATNNRGSISDDEGDILCLAYHDALSVVEDMEPQTPEGVAAKALVAHNALLAGVNGLVGVPWRDQADLYERVSIDVLALVAGAHVPLAVAFQDPEDVAVQTACARFYAVNVELRRVVASAKGLRIHTPECQAQEAAVAALNDQIDEALDAVAAAPPASLRGMAHKARLLLAMPPELDDTTRASFGAAIARDLLVLAGEVA